MLGILAQVGAGAGNAVKSATGMLMPGNNKEEKEGRKSDDHQDNKAAKDLDHEMGKDPKRMEKMVSVPGQRNLYLDSSHVACLRVIL